MAQPPGGESKRAILSNFAAGLERIFAGFKVVEINSPMEVIDHEKTRYHLG